MPDPSRPTSQSLDRRGFLAGAASLAAIGGLPSPASARTRIEPPGKLAKNLIFAVADGCGPGAVQLGELFVNMRDGRSLNWIDLWKRRDAQTSLIDTCSANGHVTDSAASASAWAIGELVNNKAVSWTPDNRTPRPLFLRAKDAGKAIGMCATTYIWDATPVAWVANAPGRKRWRALAEQLVESGANVALGGGARAFPEDVLALDPSMRVVRNRDELLDTSTGDRRLLGLFAPETFPYQTEYDESIPMLREMATLALDRLRDASPEGFCLVVEGAKVDHAAHANDAGALVDELAHFDETIGALIDFADEDGETLLVVTTDHANANPAITYYDERGRRSFENLLKHRHSFRWILSRLRETPEDMRKPEAIFELLSQASGLELTGRDLEMIRRYTREEPIDAFTENDRLVCLMGSILASHTGVAFLSPNHTSDPVTATALGPGAELFDTYMRIDEIHHRLVAAMGLPAIA
jgi:alkaline phosphatase